MTIQPVDEKDIIIYLLDSFSLRSLHCFFFDYIHSLDANMFDYFRPKQSRYRRCDSHNDWWINSRWSIARVIFLSLSLSCLNNFVIRFELNWAKNNWYLNQKIIDHFIQFSHAIHISNNSVSVSVRKREDYWSPQSPSESESLNDT